MNATGKRELLARAVELRDAGRLFDPADADMHDLFAGTIDRFCDIAIRDACWTLVQVTACCLPRSLNSSTSALRLMPSIRWSGTRESTASTAPRVAQRRRPPSGCAECRRLAQSQPYAAWQEYYL
jgi:hypothetical protein